MIIADNLHEDNDKPTYSALFGWAYLITMYIALFTYLHKKDPEALPHVWQCTKNVGNKLITSFSGGAEQKQPPSPKMPTRFEPAQVTRNPASLVNDPLFPLTFKGFLFDPFEQVEAIRSNPTLPLRRRRHITK